MTGGWRGPTHGLPPGLVSPDPSLTPGCASQCGLTAGTTVRLLATLSGDLSNAISPLITQPNEIGAADCGFTNSPDTDIPWCSVEWWRRPPLPAATANVHCVLSLRPRLLQQPVEPPAVLPSRNSDLTASTPPSVLPSNNSDLTASTLLALTSKNKF